MSAKRKASEEDINPSPHKSQRPLVKDHGVFTMDRIRKQSMNEQLYNMRCEVVFQFTVENGNAVISTLLMLNAIQMRTLLHDSVAGNDSWVSYAPFKPMHKELDEIAMITVVTDDLAAIDSIADCKAYYDQLGPILKAMQDYCLLQGCYAPQDIVSLFQDQNADYRSMIKQSELLRTIVFKTLEMITPTGIHKYQCFDGTVFK